jgi:alginate O-acetyltransferase complex protein AlgI
LSLLSLLILIVASLIIGWVIPTRWRAYSIIFISVITIYWLQPDLPIRNLDFWLPTTSIILTVLVWLITQQISHGDEKSRKLFLGVGLFTVSIILLISLTRYTGIACCITPARPPPITHVLFGLAVAGLLALLPVMIPNTRRFLGIIAICIIIGFLIILKSPILLTAASANLRNLTGQPADLASSQDVIWFGFSFLSFRLLHTLFDYRSGKLPAYRLDEFVIYTLFFPALPAGPIDRSQRFINDLRNPPTDNKKNRIEGTWRIIFGIFKKFVLADLLALIALNSRNSHEVNSTLWLWLILYAYALMIYFDFSGYTDVAIGMGKYMGISLPENFNQPYLKQNLTSFWNSWHITLAQWFRAYYFNPVTRFLRSRPYKIPVWLIILISQVSTMFLIGIWHGITWNFAIWGLWHGAGLFINNRWTDWMRPRFTSQGNPNWINYFLHFGNWFITFNFVALGWVWFALPSPEQSLEVFRKLFGF